MKKIYTSVEIGADTIRILVCELISGKFRCLAVSSVRSKGISNGVITDEEQLIERLKLAIDDISNRINIVIKKVMLIIPSKNAEFEVYRNNIPIISEDKTVTIKDMLRAESSCLKNVVPNMEVVNVTAINYNIYENGSLIETIKNPEGKKCDRLGIKAMIVTLPKSHVISYLKVAEQSGLEVVDITISSVCDYEQIRDDDTDDLVCGIINIGKETTCVSCFNKGIITSSSVINHGSKIIDDDISYIYNISKKTARKMKENFGVAHLKYANKNETFEVKDINDNIISINQYEISKIINKRITELLNIAKNELKVLTNKQISYIMVLGGITDMPAMNFIVEEVIGVNAKVYNLNILGIRKARFITSIGAIKYFAKKVKLRKKEYSMFSSDDIDNMIHSKTKIGRNDSVFGKLLSYFFDN